MSTNITVRASRVRVGWLIEDKTVVDVRPGKGEVEIELFDKWTGGHMNRTLRCHGGFLLSASVPPHSEATKARVERELAIHRVLTAKVGGDVDQREHLNDADHVCESEVHSQSLLPGMESTKEKTR